MERETPPGLAEEERVLSVFLRDGRFTALPVKRAKRLVVLRFFARQFETGRVYPEKEVNAIIARFYPDWCTVRRELVDFGFMAREGGIYRLLDAPE
ncbi:MAG TPA: DUF2087 domain-containing protein [Candidatus Limnocylindria bacterium]|nr:DUF2087 domain-containing protein [Candidatus Limnocylindria bacterium]